MLQNVGEVDRVIRVVLGTLLFYGAYTLSEGLEKWIFFSVSFLVLVAGFSGYSGLYQRLGISTKWKRGLRFHGQQDD